MSDVGMAVRDDSSQLIMGNHLFLRWERTKEKGRTFAIFLVTWAIMHIDIDISILNEKYLAYFVWREACVISKRTSRAPLSLYHYLYPTKFHRPVTIHRGIMMNVRLILVSSPKMPEEYSHYM